MEYNKCQALITDFISLLFPNTFIVTGSMIFALFVSKWNLVKVGFIVCIPTLFEHSFMCLLFTSLIHLESHFLNC